MGWVDTILQGLLLGGLYALFATGLSLIFGVMRIVNLAHGDLSILAAFLAVVAVEALGVQPVPGPVPGRAAHGRARATRSRRWSSTACSGAGSCRRSW